MAAISSISNGEALSSVRTKLNSVITEINLLDPTDWIDYSATSTVVGWSSFTTKQIAYRKIGKQIFCNFNIVGTSNSASATFTLPDNNNSIFGSQNVNIAITDNGVNINTAGRVITIQNSNLITINKDRSGAIFTTSGTKGTSGQFFYFID